MDGLADLGSKKCPKCGKRQLEKIGYNLCYCKNCNSNLAYVDGEWMIERKVNGTVEYFALKKHYSKSPFSKRNSPTGNKRFVFGFY